jgi:hypothetical protein
MPSGRDALAASSLSTSKPHAFGVEVGVLFITRAEVEVVVVVVVVLVAVMMA